MTSAAIRFWFCMAVAVISAAIADPLIESASNSGLFGPGNFTDHSNLDVIPAIVVGLLFVVFHLFGRVRKALKRPNARAVGVISPLRLLPWSFATQILVLYGMETVEQWIVAGHCLGGSIWLGGPVPLSLGIHGAFCLLTTYILAFTLQVLAAGTLRIVQSLCALATRPRRIFVSSYSHVLSRDTFALFAPLVCRIGKRAPPIVAVEALL